MFHNKRIRFERRSGEGGGEECWFCREQADASLVVYEGRHCYVSMEKGPCCLHHFQVIPYAHVDNLGRLGSEAADEVESVMRRLANHFKQQGCQCIDYERALPLSQRVNHAMLHFLPIRQSAPLDAAFERLNGRDRLGFAAWEGGLRKSPFYLLLGVGGRKYLREVGRKERVQADIMRVVVAQLLGNPRLANWKQCLRTPQQLEGERGEALRELEQAGLKPAQQ
jgi:diadenosine tetraphosphate (Ap4A) HIT family hydrolase